MVTSTLMYEDFSKYKDDKEDVFGENRVNESGDSRRGEALRKQYEPMWDESDTNADADRD